jgi:hypothetical protein
MGIGILAEAIGKGIIAGIAGTAVMTVSSTIEMKLRGRQASEAPAKVAGKVLGVEPKGEQEKQRFSNMVHWGYGTAWGIPRGLIAATGLKGVAADVAHFSSIWGTALLMLPAAGAAPPVKEWGATELAIDAFHHAVYAAAAGIAYAWLDRH